MSVYDAAHAQVHALNPTAARVWRRCDGATSPETIAAVLRVEMGIPEAEAVVELTPRASRACTCWSCRATHATIDRHRRGAGCSNVAWPRRCCRRLLDCGALCRGCAVAAAAGRADADQRRAESRTPWRRRWRSR